MRTHTIPGITSSRWKLGSYQSPRKPPAHEHPFEREPFVAAEKGFMLKTWHFPVTVFLLSYTTGSVVDEWQKCVIAGLEERLGLWQNACDLLIIVDNLPGDTEGASQTISVGKSKL